MSSPASFVRRTVRGGLAIACAACIVLAAFGMGGWAAGVGVGAAVALGNFWLLARAILQLGAGLASGDAAREGRATMEGRSGHLRAALQGTALRLVLAGAALALALIFLPVHPLGVAAGLVGAHASMAVLWMAAGMRRVEG